MNVLNIAIFDQDHWYLVFTSSKSVYTMRSQKSHAGIPQSSHKLKLEVENKIISMFKTTNK